LDADPGCLIRLSRTAIGHGRAVPLVTLNVRAILVCTTLRRGAECQIQGMRMRTGEIPAQGVAPAMGE
jgi:hypothetical protein